MEDFASNNSILILTVVVPTIFAVAFALLRVLVKRTETTLDDEALDAIEAALKHDVKNWQDKKSGKGN